MPFVVRKSSVLCCLLLSGFLHAQVRGNTRPLSPSSFKLVVIKVTGSVRYTPDEIIAASGLQTGQTVSEEDFKKASQQLGESGAFTNVAYAFQFSREGTKLDLQVADTSKLARSRFDNFPWWSDVDLVNQLHSRIPLFKGELPLAGSLPDQVSDALQALVIEKSSQSHVDYLRSGPLNQPIDAFVYSVSGPAIRIRKFEFPGTSGAESSALQEAAAKLQNENYSRAALRVQAEKDLLPVYLERGFLKAAFSDPVPRIAHEDANEVEVDVSFEVKPGLQYKCTRIEFSGRGVFPPDRLKTLVHQPIGEPANDLRLHQDMEAVQKLYGTRGYMAAIARPAPTLDDANAAVSYLVEITEGDKYTMGDLDIRGLDSHTTARLAEAWKIRGGDAYDSSYLFKFLDETNDMLPGGQWNITPHVTLDDSGKTVDVTIRYDPKER
jgi:outer membrane protein assembly factor BamA